MVLAEPIEVTLVVVDALNKIGVRYLLGGSLASSLHGIPRATNDVDMVAELCHEHVEPLVEALSGEFYVDADMIREAIRRRASFNIIHLSTMMKVDVFILRGDPHSITELERLQLKQIGGRELAVASAEDIVLEKLRWFRLGQGVSDQQWNDVLGVLKIQGDDLDTVYLRTWADDMGVGDLLDRAFDEAGTIEKNRE
jgi:hypothetical protein